MAKRGKLKGRKTGNDKVVVRNSRKIYLVLYLMGIIVIGVLLYVYLVGQQLSTFALVIAIVFILFILKYSELHRLMRSYEISNNYLGVTKGLISKKTTKILIESIVDIDLKQSFWQRLLNYGTLDVHAASGANIIDIRNINNPVKYRDLIEERLDEKLS